MAAAALHKSFAMYFLAYVSLLDSCIAMIGASIPAQQSALIIHVLGLLVAAVLLLKIWGQEGSTAGDTHNSVIGRAGLWVLCVQHRQHRICPLISIIIAYTGACRVAYVVWACSVMHFVSPSTPLVSLLGSPIPHSVIAAIMGKVWQHGGCTRDGTMYSHHHHCSSHSHTVAPGCSSTRTTHHHRIYVVDVIPVSVATGQDPPHAQPLPHVHACHCCGHALHRSNRCCRPMQCFGMCMVCLCTCVLLCAGICSCMLIYHTTNDTDTDRWRDGGHGGQPTTHRKKTDTHHSYPPHVAFSITLRGMYELPHAHAAVAYAPQPPLVPHTGCTPTSSSPSPPCFPTSPPPAPASQPHGTPSFPFNPPCWNLSTTPMPMQHAPPIPTWPSPRPLHWPPCAACGRGPPGGVGGPPCWWGPLQR